MKTIRIYICILAVLTMALGGLAAEEQNLQQSSEAVLREAMVKVFTTFNPADYHNPWSMQGPRTRTGSGAVIRDGMIITNAHVVSDHTFIQVRRYGDNTRYEASVKAVLHQSDLAVLTVDDPEFYRDVTPLEFGEIPETHQEVSVYGFPRGGDALSITKGIVSRIEHQSYVHSSAVLLAGQIDAAINPGSSGGPVISDGKIVGVIMQAIPSAQNIGYMVPLPVIRTFMENVDDDEIRGFPSLGIGTQHMESRDLRSFYQMTPDQTGVLVTQVVPHAPSDGILQPGDVLLKIDNYPVANDGTVEFREHERTSFSYAVQKHQIGTEIPIELLRDGEIHQVSVTLSSSIEDHRMVPSEQYDVLPSYYIYGGFVFAPLTKNLLQVWGSSWFNIAPKDVVNIYQYGIPEYPGEQVILITRVLAADVNDGYQQTSFWIVDSVNGERVRSMEELIASIEDSGEPYIVLENPRGRKIILDAQRIEAAHERILSLYRISEDRSEDLQ